MSIQNDTELRSPFDGSDKVLHIHAKCVIQTTEHEPWGSERT